jgi:hypothetical protein
MDGSDGSTTFTDNSLSAKTATVTGNAQISTAQSKFGGASGVFDKVGDRISYSSSDFAFGSGDFTIEFWARSRDVSSSTQRGIFQISSATGGLSTSYANGILLVQGIGSGGGVFGGLAVFVNNVQHGFAAGMTVNAWHHIAIARQGSTVRLFFNGVAGVTATNAGNLTAQNLVIGGAYDTSFLYDGYLDDFRITNYAVYTANFTPPTAAFPDA